MVKRSVLASLTLLFAFSLTACRPPADGASGARGTAPNVTVTIDLIADPQVGPVDVTVTVLREGNPVEDATVELTGDMTHAGMVPVIDTMLPAGNGTYRSDTFAFDMAGDWILTADVRLPNGERASGEVLRTVQRP